uniref:SET domain-containing protein n=1 Tax=Trichogramma kaykai TaxID=54128 RepID=A0ABD2W0K5_9HYME
MTDKKSGDGGDVKYKIERSDRVGRYLVAAKSLEAGEVILEELPFVVGPKAASYPCCLGCYSPWPSAPVEGDGSPGPLCPDCGWPVCGDECARASQHRDYECRVFAEAKERFNAQEALGCDRAQGVPHLECVTPLRLLLASEKDKARWESEVSCMESHDKERREKPQWQADQVNVVEYIRNRLKLDRFSEELIQRCCGILEINNHEIRTSRGFLARGLYPRVSIMNHSCVSNTAHSCDPAPGADFRVQLRAAVRVAAGTELTGSYTHALLPTMLRRQHLAEGKYFDCACTRCSDPSELGTHMSSLKCNKCDNGLVLPLDSLDPESQWKCTHCDFSTSSQAVRRVQTIIHADMEQAEAYTAADGPEAIQLRESFMKKYHSVLHPRHALLTIPRFSLAQLYGRVEEYFLDDLPDVVLEHKIELCRLCLQVLDKIEPGLQRSRGMMLYELHAPLLFIAKGQWSAGAIDAPTLKSKMTEAAQILKEAADILCLEPAATPEAEIGQGAKLALEQLNKSIADL